ncbi:hypothetical protein IAT40_002163 [Kwoniella sp. CBS 6097]
MGKYSAPIFVSSPYSDQEAYHASASVRHVCVSEPRKKKLFEGMIMYVSADVPEKYAVEEYLKHDAGAAINQIPSSADFIIAPESVDACELAKKLGPEIGTKVIRINWIHRSLHHGRVVSKAKYRGWEYRAPILPPVTAVSQSKHTLAAAHTGADKQMGRPRGDVTRSVNHNILVTPSAPAVGQKTSSRTLVRTNGEEASMRDGFTAATISLDLESTVNGSLDTGEAVVVQRKGTTGISSWVSPFNTLAEQPLRLSAHATRNNRWGPTSSSYVPRDPKPSSGSMAQMQVSDDPAGFNPKPVSSRPAWSPGNGLRQFWPNQPFWIVGNEASKIDIALKIEDHGGHVTETLAEATRVIFVRPTEACDIEDIEAQLAETHRLNEFRPCVALAEGWIHNSHGNENPKCWKDFKIRKAQRLFDDTFWEDTTLGAGVFEEYEKPTRMVSVVPVIASPSQVPHELTDFIEVQEPSVVDLHLASPRPTYDSGSDTSIGMTAITQTIISKPEILPFQIASQATLAPPVGPQVTALVDVLAAKKAIDNSIPRDLRWLGRQEKQTMARADQLLSLSKAQREVPDVSQSCRRVEGRLQSDAATREETRYPTPISPPLAPLPRTPIGDFGPSPDVDLHNSLSDEPPTVGVIRTDSQRPASPIIPEEVEDDYADLAGIFSDEEEIDFAEDEPEEMIGIVMEVEKNAIAKSIQDCNTDKSTQPHIVDDMQQLILDKQRAILKPRVIPSFKKKRKSMENENLAGAIDLGVDEGSIKNAKRPKKVLTKVQPRDKKDFNALYILHNTKAKGAGFQEAGGMYEYARSIGKESLLRRYKPILKARIPTLPFRT